MILIRIIRVMNKKEVSAVIYKVCFYTPHEKNHSVTILLNGFSMLEGC